MRENRGKCDSWAVGSHGQRRDLSVNTSDRALCAWRGKGGEERKRENRSVCVCVRVFVCVCVRVRVMI